MNHQTSPEFDPTLEPRRLRVLKPGEAAELPHSLEAEEYLLSAILVDPRDVIPRCVTARFTAESFYDPRHGKIYAAIVQLYQAQREVTVATLGEHLRDTRKLDDVGGYPMLAQVSQKVPTTAQTSYFIDQVRKTWILRQTIRKATKLMEKCYSYSGEPLVELLGSGAAWFAEATTRARLGDRGSVETLGDVVESIRAETRLRHSGKEDRSRWVFTGFPEFDNLESSSCLGPFGQVDEDHVVLIGGGSSAGKSVIMRQLAGEALRRGQRVLVYTLETSTRGFLRLLAGAWAGVNMRTVAAWPKDMLARYEVALDEVSAIADKRLFVMQTKDNPALGTIEGLERHLRSWVAQYGAPELVLLDYMQIVAPEKRCSTREQEVASVAHKWQALQREIGCVTVAGAQLNEASLAALRQKKLDKDGKVIHELPTRGALRESQALYHDADIVIFLHKPVVDRTGRDQIPPETPRPEMWLCVDKRRNGPLGKACTWFDKTCGRFEPIMETRTAPVAPQGVRVPRAAWMKPAPAPSFPPRSSEHDSDDPI